MTSPAELYSQLTHLVDTNKSFHKSDYKADFGFFRIFSYHFATYSDFLLPGALECRGSMFRVDNEGNFIAIASRTPKKFFNLGENPFTMNLDLGDPNLVMKKEDGSLMSTYLGADGKVKLKSKASVTSRHCQDAMRYLETQPGMKNDLQYLSDKGYTVSLEWTAPWNRVVVAYDEPRLTGISVIDNRDGSVHLLDFVERIGCQSLAEAWVKDFEYEGDLADVIKHLTGEEGVVCITASGVTCKIKSDWYLSIHQSKSMIDSPKALIGVILEGASDDLRGLFDGDFETLDKIDRYERHIFSEYNEVVRAVEDFHAENRHLGRKEYAMKAKEAHSPMVFGLQMMAAAGRDYTESLKEKMMRNYSVYSTYIDAHADSSSIQLQ